MVVGGGGDRAHDNYTALSVNILAVLKTERGLK